MVTRKDILAAPYYQKYIDAVKETDVRKALKKSSSEFRGLLEKIPRKKIDHAYEPGKWTLQEMLQHVVDAERVFAYRALHIARKDTAPLPSFDEKQWAAQARAADRKWNDLIKEFKTVRKSTEILFESLNEEQLLAAGTASEQAVNVLGLGFIMAGHVQHHIRVIQDRYLKK